MCNCVDIKVGSYDNQVKVYNPGHIERPYISIDKCLVEEIYFLWGMGVITTGCCCGHNVQRGYVGVVEESIPIMLALGYENQFNECNPEDRGEFYTKTL